MKEWQLVYLVRHGQTAGAATAACALSHIARESEMIRENAL